MEKTALNLVLVSVLDSVVSLKLFRDCTICSFFFLVSYHGWNDEKAFFYKNKVSTVIKKN